MRWTVTFRACFLGILFALSGLLRPAVVAAQAPPAGQGLVADSTELRVLRQLYAATGGAQWTARTHWPTTPAQWAAATLDSAATWQGVRVTNGDVTDLRLAANQLQGPFPACLTRLGGLRFLDLSRNQLSGSLPDLRSLPYLEYLHAAGNQLSGPLPTGLGTLAALNTLDLAYNRLTGRLPGELGRCRSLRSLLLTSNQLSGPLPDSLALLPYLPYCYLANNRFSGPLPAAYAQLPGSFFIVSGNELSGPLPAGLQFPYLYLNDNHFSGALPASYGTNSGQEQLILQGNDFTQLPAFTPKPGTGRLLMYFGRNLLAFDSFEPNQRTPGVFQDWSGEGFQRQAPADTLPAVAGRPATLDGRIGGAHNSYQWQRWVGGQWVDLPGQTQVTLSWALVTAAETGSYRTSVTNSWVVGLTLYSRPHYLDVLPYAALAQNRPDDTNQNPTQSPLAAPLPEASRPQGAADSVNYVRTWMPRVALTDAARVPRAPVDSVSQSTQYLDGLGRPVQTVLRQASPQRRDMVQPQAYDGLDREPRQFLPYPDSVGGTGGYRPRALAAQYDFYRRTTLPGGGYGPPASTDPTRGVARTGAAYAETLYEASPLGRVVAQGAPGEAWQLGAGHVAERQERPNTDADSVLRFTPGYDPRQTAVPLPNYYAPGELWGTDVSEAHGPNEVGARGYRTLEWKDKLGQVVLRQVEASRVKVGTVAYSRWLRTAYAYDDFQRLRFVVQPEGTRRLLGGQAPAAAQPFVFHYRYDGRGRQVAKQVPGTDGETLVVYDQLDRPVLSQDAQQRTRREWSWTKYDALGRVVLSGLLTRADTLGQVTLQSWATADTATAHQYEQRSGDSNAHPQYYTLSQAFPKLGAAAQQGFDSWQTLTATYYDDYDFNNNGAPDAQYDPQLDGYFAGGQAPVPDALRTTGLVTQTRTRVLGVAANDPQQAAWLTTTTFYDARARPVQVQALSARKDRNGEPQWDLLTTQLDFPGKVVQSVARHEGLNHLPVVVQEFFTYDHTGRVLTTRQQLPGEARAARLDSVQYNEIGQAVRKSLGTGRLLQQVDYAYNIRGWLTQLNDPHQPDPADLFHLSLHYERGFTKGYEQYNGNLTGQTWRGRDGVQRAYGYVYDPLSRLRQGDFVARAGGRQGTLSTATAWNTEADHYRLSFVSYDDNGNILTLRRRGLLQNATHLRGKQYGAVDNLTYAYAGNRLQAVDDAVTGNQLAKPATYHGAPTSLAGDFQEAGVRLGQEYLYDANGNLTQDKNKNITGIAYNHLNLPRQIRFGTGADSLVFRYTASGQKVTKLVYQRGQPVQRTDYLGPYQYEQDSLRFFPHAEGRVLRFVSYDPAGQASVGYQREYTVKDHLGNLRLAYRLGQDRTYAATLEQDAATRKRETQQFDSLSVSLPVAQNVGMSLARTGSYAAVLNAGGASPQPLGPLTQLTVQKGDTLRVSAPGRYQQAVQNHGFAFSLASFVASLLQPAPAGAPASADGRRRGGLPLLQVGLNAGSLAALTQASNGVPKGYLRVLVFNTDSVLVDQRTVQLSQAALNNYEVLQTGFLPIGQDGYVSVYVGNESGVDVLFDDVQVEYRQGLLVQQVQYDPAGLELAGLAPPSPGIRGLNNYRFNGKEFQADLGLAWNHQDWRFFDPQLLRWHSGDPELENGQESWTPYSFGYDNAVRYEDANGRCPTCPPLLQAGAVASEAATLLEEAAPVLEKVAVLTGLTALGAWIGNHLPSTAQVTEFLNAGSSNGSMYTPMGIPAARIYRDLGILPKVRSVTDGNGRVNASTPNSAQSTAGTTRRVQTPGDKTTSSERAARRQVFRENKVPTSKANNFKRVKDPDENPNIRGPKSDKDRKGAPAEKIQTEDVNGKSVTIDHHKHGHVFKDTNEHEQRHYHNPSGAHISY